MVEFRKCFTYFKARTWHTKTYEHNLLVEKSVVDRHGCHMAVLFEVFVD